MTYKWIVLSLVLLASTVHAKTLKVMQYNAENFFDTKFDEGTDDYTYLPLSVKQEMPGHAEKCQAMGSFAKDCLNLDWNEKILASKIESIAKVIKSFDETGKGPDIIVMEEIENQNVLNLLVEKGLKGLGYSTVLVIEGDDSRGIDVGIISKFPLTHSKHHSIFVKGKKLNTRGITEAVLNVEGKKVVVFANHWPSQNNPVEQRVESAKVLDKLAAKSKADLVIAAGDFNVIAHDSPYPYNYLSGFTDTEVEARKINNDLNPGTHYYRGEWSSLDKIFIHRNSVPKADYSSYQIMNREFIMVRDPKTGSMAPNRFNNRSGKGFSDHLPVGIDFNY